MRKYVGLIPARSGSKGIKHKNIRDLGGVPLILWSIAQAKNSKLDAVIFDSDSSKYLELVESKDVIKNLRPAHLAEDASLTVDVIKNVCERHRLSKDDFVVLLQPTCPFRSSDLINKTIDFLNNNPLASVISVVDCDAYHPLRMKRIVGGQLINYIDTGEEDMRPRQDLPKVYIRSGSIYAASVNQLLVNNGFGSELQIPIIENSKNTINIDIERDFQVAELMLSQNQECKNIFKDVQKGIKS